MAAHQQTMEKNLTDLIFHCTLQLSTMTDSKIFVLMENPNDGSGGRRFCGSEALVEEFATCGLHPRGNDVEMELNVDSPPVRQKQLQNQQQQYQQQQQHLVPLALVPNKGILPSSGAKRHGATNAALIESDNPAKKVCPSEEASWAKEDSSSLALECRTEVKNLIDSDFDEKTSAENESSFTNGGGSSSAFLESSDSSFLPSSSIIPIHDPSSYSGGEEELPSRRVGLDVPNLAAKECIVTQKVDPAKAFIRGTEENKLLASICYDAGKAIALSNPHSVESPLFREHCKERIHAYVQHFPEFVKVEVTLEETALYYQKYQSRQKYTPESFMKMNARAGIGRALEAMRKIGNG